MNKKLGIVMLLFTFSYGSKVIAQNNSFVIYYDSLWKPVDKQNAFYYTQFVKQNASYQCLSYWSKSNSLYSRSVFADTTYIPGVGNFKKAIGKMIRYYENGAVSDSIGVDNDGVVSQQYHYTDNGKIETYIFNDKANQRLMGQHYDNAGNKLPGYFVYQEVPKFPGGVDAWINYLTNHLKSKVPVKKGAPIGLYTVVVSFLVNKDGKVIEVKAENDPGFGTAEEAIRVIQASPDWIAAIQFGNKVIYRQRQSITFNVGKG